MAKLSKRMKKWVERVNAEKQYSFTEAVQLLKDCATTKFDESVEVAVNLGVNVRDAEQNIRGASVLPKGSGKAVRVAVFAGGDQAAVAKAEGADMIGLEDLVEQIQGGDLNFDVAIATPDVMPLVSKLGRLLGPRNLMPNPKVGTVTKDVKQAIINAKQGQVRYRTDKNGIIHCAIGKISFSAEAIQENLESLLSDLMRAKPSVSKGVYMKKISLSTTMGPGIMIDQNSLSFH